MRVPFSPPRIDDKIIAAVSETLRSGWITTGPRTVHFEEKLAEYLQVNRVKCLSSATAGLELALRWFGVQEDDEVIVPAYTFAATANVVVHCGAKPIMVDVLDDFTINPTLVERAITRKTKAIIPVDFGGWPCGYDELRSVIANSTQFIPGHDVQEKLGRILILADAAHALGSRYDDKPAGLQADLAAFSFHAVKNLTTAEGGALAFNLPTPFSADALHQHFSLLALHGQTKDAQAKLSGGNWEYDIALPGYKCNMPDVLAAIGLVELERYESETLPRRQHITALYDVLLGKDDRYQLPVFSDERRRSSHHLYPIRLRNNNEAQRNRLMARAHEAGVDLNVHFKPLPMMSYYKSLGYRIEDYPVSLDNYSREVSLPVFYDLTDQMIERVVNVITSAT